MSGKINELFSLFNQFMQSTPRIQVADSAAPFQQPQPATDGQGPPMTQKLIVSRKPRRLSSASEAKANPRESPVPPVAGYPEPATSTQVVYVHELSRAAVHVSAEYF
jgi:hypothetical protein